jgi:predicted HNH restriction endonuclease
VENMILVCPNHHAAIHRDDAPFDYKDLSYTFSKSVFRNCFVEVCWACCLPR